MAVLFNWPVVTPWKAQVRDIADAGEHVSYLLDARKR